MIATALSTTTKDQLEKSILLEVVTQFLKFKQSTSRHSLVIKFKGQPILHQVLFELTNGSRLCREGVSVPTTEEKYLPGALAFEFCGDRQFREEAKSAVTIVLHLSAAHV